MVVVVGEYNAWIAERGKRCLPSSSVSARMASLSHVATIVGEQSYVAAGGVGGSNRSRGEKG